MNRRDLMIAALGSGGAALMPPAVRSAMVQGNPGDAAFFAVLERIDRDASPWPQSVTSAGRNGGSDATLAHRLNDRSSAGLVRRLGERKKALAAIEAIDPLRLSPNVARYRDVLLYRDRMWIDGVDRFGLGDVQSPFVITSWHGAYWTTPDFLDSSHQVRNAEDAEAYLDRVRAFATVLDQDSERQVVEAKRGYLAPRFILEKAIVQMVALRAPSAADHRLTRSLVRRTTGRIPGDWGARCAAIVAAQVYPALDRQIALLRRLSPTARTSAGIGDLPDGAALYVAALENATTTSSRPADLEHMGLAAMAAIGATLDELLSAEGMTRGTIGERLSVLSQRPDLLYADSAEGRAAIVRDAQARHDAMVARLSGLFGDWPNLPLRIEPMSGDVEPGADTANYYVGSADGTVPARLRLNLTALAGSPRYELPALICHEGVPGHHLQKSYARRGPAMRFTAYSEGWALHAEELADGWGAYATPLERIGYFRSRLFRAARLVVDTGLHARRWSREQAVAYLVARTGMTAQNARREVDRYCIRPGQACSYMVGYQSWQRVWSRAGSIIGPKFKPMFFGEVMGAGELPLPMLETLVETHARKWA